MSFRTHKIKFSTDGKSITFWDTTPEALYEDNGIDIYGDVLAFEIAFSTDIGGYIVMIDVTAMWLESRDPSGLILTAEEFGISSFTDDIYIFNSTMTLDPSVSIDPLSYENIVPIYPRVKNTIMRNSLRIDWKRSFGPSSVYSRNEMRSQSLLKNLEYAEELQLQTEAERILITLLKLNGLWTGTI